MTNRQTRLSDMIRQARLERDPPMTQEVLAAELGITQPSVSAWEHDTARPTMSSLVLLAEVLDLDPAALFEAMRAAMAVADEPEAAVG